MTVAKLNLKHQRVRPDQTVGKLVNQGDSKQLICLRKQSHQQLAHSVMQL